MNRAKESCFPNVDHPDLFIGVDGGGTKTVARLVRRGASGQTTLLGQGQSGPGNPRGAGETLARDNIAAAVNLAFSAAQLDPGTVQAACLALAGAGASVLRQRMQQWAAGHLPASRVRVVHDAEAVLAAAKAENNGVALIAGTGSFAFGRGEGDRVARAGGWGHLLGDEGSGYALGLAALGAVCRAADGRAPDTRLSAAVLTRAQVSHAAELIGVYAMTPNQQQAIAHLAPLVTEAAESGDTTARNILDRAAHDLSELVQAVVRNLAPADRCYTLAMSGGVLVGCPRLRNRVQQLLANQRFAPQRLVVVIEPVEGAVRLAASL